MTTINDIKNTADITARIASDFFSTYGLEIEKHLNNRYELSYFPDGIHGETFEECEAESDSEAYIKLVPSAIEYVELNAIEPKLED